MKKSLLIAALVVFACSSMFLLSSCAKREVVVEEEEITAVPGPEVEITVEEEPAIEVEEEVERGELAEIEPLEELEVAAVEEEPGERALRAARFEGESIYFDFDKSFIKPEYRSVLEEKAQFLKDYPDVRVRIEGNCDERGTNEYNLALGERRSNSAKGFLTSLGVSADRIEMISYGEERPLFLGHNEEAWAQNRRDDFVIIKE